MGCSSFYSSDVALETLSPPRGLRSLTPGSPRGGGAGDVLGPATPICAQPSTSSADTPATHRASRPREETLMPEQCSLPRVRFAGGGAPATVACPCTAGSCHGCSKAWGKMALFSGQLDAVQRTVRSLQSKGAEGGAEPCGGQCASLSSPVGVLIGAVSEIRSDVGELQQNMANLQEVVSGELQALRALLERSAIPLARRSVSPATAGVLENSEIASAQVDDSQATEGGLDDHSDSSEFRAPMIPLPLVGVSERLMGESVRDVQHSQEQSQVLVSKKRK